MSIFGDKSRRRPRTWAIALALAISLVAVAALPGSAMAGPDELKGGTVQLQLKGSGGLKFKPKSLGLPITGGAVDPITGAGTAKARGSFKARRGKAKTKVTITSVTFGANGGPGSITAKVGKKAVPFATLAGGTVARDGYGARINGVAAELSSAGAKALRKALSPSKGKAASAAGSIKGGTPLGSVSATTIPKSVEVKPGGTMEVVSPLSLITKLHAHCVDALNVIDPGVSAIAPASLNPATLTFTFPIVGGSFAPDFSDGHIVSAGGQLVKKNNGILTPSACTSAAPPAGTSVTQSDFETQFSPSLNQLSAHATLPTGPFGLAPAAVMHLDSTNSSFDPNTNTVTLTDVPLTLTLVAAFTLNNVFPTQSGNASDDFAEGDDFGTVSLTATIR